MNEKLVFIAIGGNSLIKSKELQKVEDQHQAIRETVRHVADLIGQGYQVLISHGNGPQVGFIMRRSEVARRVTGLRTACPSGLAVTRRSIRLRRSLRFQSCTFISGYSSFIRRILRFFLVTSLGRSVVSST